MFSIDDLFCTKCEAILPIVEMTPYLIQCIVCKAEKLKQIDKRILIDRQEKSFVRTIADTEESTLIAQDEVIQVEHYCIKCGFNKASYMTQQTRSADEGQTVFYTCVKCKHKMIEYS